jgi:type IV pilus assembly protein PilQ
VIRLSLMPAVMRGALGAAAIGMAVWTGSALAQPNSIESVTSSQQGATTVVRIDLKSAPSQPPNGFSIGNPPRVALDFADTQNAIGRNSIDLEQGDVRNVAVAQAGGRARLVLNLKRSLSFATRVEGNSVFVTLDPPASTASAGDSARSYSFASAATSARASLRDIDFRRGRDGEGRVIVDLSEGGPGVDVRIEGSTIVVDFLEVGLPENLRRRLDVTDFGTPVRSVRAFQQGDRTRLVIEPAGQWEHNAYQSDTQFVVEVKAIREDPNRLAQGSQPQYRGEKLSLNFQNVDIRALLQIIADFTNLNIVTSDTVTGSLTLRLKDVPWDQALDIILQSRSLDLRKNGNVIMIAPREELAAREKAELEARQQIAEIEPVRTETFQLNYQKAEEVQKLLGNEKQRVLSKRGSVVIDQRTNKVFVQDTVSRLEAVRKVIEQIDIPVRQVLIEARIVEADDRFSRNLGARFGYTRINASAGTFLGNTPQSSLSGNLQGVADLTPLPTAATPGTTALANTNFVNLPAAAISGTQAAAFAVSLFNSSLTKFINLEISALEADQRGKVLSSPRVLTADQGTAIIEQGKEIPYQQATSSGATAVQFKKAVLKLEVTPQITPEGSVIMAVKVSRDNAAELLPTGVAIDTRRVETQVLVENGGTVVIGGIYEQIERDRVNKVPFLGDIPGLGNLFRNNERQNDRSELLVFLTPRVITDTAMAR